MFTPLLFFERKIFMITVYTPLSEKEARRILHKNIVGASRVTLINKILTRRDFTDILLDNIADTVQCCPSFHSTGLIIYVIFDPKLITAIDFSEFSWINRVKYVSYGPDNPPKLIKNLQTSIQQNPR